MFLYLLVRLNESRKFRDPQQGFIREIAQEPGGSAVLPQSKGMGLQIDQDMVVGFRFEPGVLPEMVIKARNRPGK